MTENNKVIGLKLIKWILKDGTERSSYYDNKIYQKTYRERHRDNINKKNECPICHGSYTNANKDKHFKTTRHIKCENATLNNIK